MSNWIDWSDGEAVRELVESDPWEYGKPGKGIVDRHGNVHVWTTTGGFDGWPFHAHYMAAFGLPRLTAHEYQRGRGYGRWDITEAFEIQSDGQVDWRRYSLSDAERARVLEILDLNPNQE